jgi:4-amino-4-deoxy-L-arabinose transferase-like glycosyltransferase
LLTAELKTPHEARISPAFWIGLALLALVARLAFVRFEPPTRLVADEHTWIGWSIEEPGGVACARVSFSPFRTHLIFYPPLYPYFVGGLYTLAGSLTAVKIGQAFLGSALVLALMRLGASMFGARAGIAAGLITALYPDLIWFSAHFWSETLFMAFLWWGMERLLAADRNERAGAAVAAGALWGLTILTRETVLYFVPVAALWLAFRRGRPGLNRGLLFAATALLVVAPWTYRNWVQFHAFVPVSIAGGQNLFQGNALVPRDETYRMVATVRGHIEQYRYAMHMGVQAIRDRQPWWIFEKLYEQMPNFWEADSLAIIHMKRWAYGDMTFPQIWTVAAVVLIPYLLVLVGFVWALARLPLDRRVALLGLLLLYYNAIHIVTHGFARYRLPVMPVLFLIVAWRLALPATTVPVPRARRLLVAAIGLVLGLCLIPGIRRDLRHPIFGGPGEPPAQTSAGDESPS